MAEYKTMVTDVGIKKITEAALNGGKINITEAAVGDGGGTDYVPTTDQKKLIRETWRGPIVYKQINEQDENIIDIKIILPSDIGGFTIREAGLFDDSGDMIVVCNIPPTEKVIAKSGVANSLTLYMHVIFSDMEIVEIKVEPTLDVMTHDEVAAMINDHIGNKNNPHNVTKDQVGLGSVPNVTTNDQMPTYTEVDELSTLTSGEKLSSAFGKIAKMVSEFIFFKSRFPVQNADIADKAVSADKIQAGAVTQPKIQDGAVTTGKLSNGAVTSAKIGDRQVGLSKLTPGSTANTVLVTVYENNQYETHWRQIDSSMIMDKQVQNADIADNTIVGSEKLKPKSVTGGRIADKTVGTDQLADKSVSADKLQAGSVTQAKIQDGAVTEGKLGDDVKSKLHSHDNKTALDKITDEKIKQWDESGGITYKITKSESTIKLVGNDGSETSVTDSDTIYTHPTYPAHAAALNKVTVDNTGHVSGVTAVTKSDITKLGIPEKDTTYDDATQITHGLMSTSDKIKLDGITDDKIEGWDSAKNQAAALSRDVNFQKRVSLSPLATISVDWCGRGLNKTTMNASDARKCWVNINTSGAATDYIMIVNGFKSDRITLQNFIDSAKSELREDQYTILANQKGIRIQTDNEFIISYDDTENGVHFGSSSGEVLLGATFNNSALGLIADPPMFYGPLYEAMTHRMPAAPVNSMVSIYDEHSFFNDDGSINTLPSNGAYYLKKCPITGEESSDAMLYVTACSVGGLTDDGLSYLAEMRCYALQSGNLYYGFAIDSYSARVLKSTHSETGFDNFGITVVWHKIAFEENISTLFRNGNEMRF